MFKQNKTLIHADFSHCGFTYNECEIINEGLKHNHTLLGLHFTGNAMNVDSLGFLKPISIDPAASHIMSRISNDQMTGTFSYQRIKLQSSSNCWICEGWTKITFYFDPTMCNNPPDHKMTPKDRVYLNLSFDHFEGDPMELDEETGIYSQVRMVPAIDIQYFFTVNDVQKYMKNKNKTRAPIDNPDISLLYINSVSNIVKNVKEMSPEYMSKLG